MSDSSAAKIVSGDLVRIKQGIYTNAQTGLARVHLPDTTPGLVIEKNGPQMLVALYDGETLITSEKACEIQK